MNEEEYRKALLEVLIGLEQQVIDQLKLAIQRLPEKTRGIELMIFPDQDGEGTFSLRVVLEGPDSFVLNKAISDYADLISVRHTSGGLVPEVPLMDPFDVEFEVNDVLSDVIGDWLSKVWENVDNTALKLPVTIVADEEYGHDLPMQLN
ncbi:MAG: DUF6389 family protein [Cytophagales bacterium]|nr:DUF6389 family protein [Cytophagales bacterium]